MGGLSDVEVEEYWFVCGRWFAKGEDDGKIIRELLPTTEDGQPLDTGLQGLPTTNLTAMIIRAAVLTGCIAAVT